MARKYARMFVHEHYLFREAHSFFELRSLKTVSFEGQITSKDKYPSISSTSNGGCTCFIILRGNFATRADLKIGKYLTIIPRARVGYEMIDSQRGA